MSRASLSPGAEQHLDRFHQLALLAGGRLRARAAAVGASRSSTFARGGEILLRPERDVEAHRLAPVREREVGIGLLRFAEGVAAMSNSKL
jgi:hypothetical protein